MLLGLPGFLFISNTFRFQLICTLLIVFLAIIYINQFKSLYRIFTVLSGCFHRPPKPHPFVKLPLESQSTMLITLVASSSGALIFALDFTDLSQIINNLIPNITVPSFFTTSGLNIPTFPTCDLPRIFSPLSDNPKSLTDYAWQLDYNRQIRMLIKYPYLWYTKDLVYLFNSPLFLSTTALILTLVNYSLMVWAQNLINGIRDVLNNMRNIFITWINVMEHSFFTEEFWRGFNYYDIPLWDLAYLARLRVVRIINMIFQARENGWNLDGMRMLEFNLANLFSLTLLQRPHLLNNITYGLIVLLNINDFDYSFELGIDYDRIWRYYIDIYNLLGEIMREDLGSEFDSDEEDYYYTYRYSESESNSVSDRDSVSDNEGVSDSDGVSDNDDISDIYGVSDSDGDSDSDGNRDS